MATTDTKTNRELKKTINIQSTEISKLRTRVSELVDDLHSVRSDLSTFKTAVSNDMKGLVEAVKNNAENRQK